jgi:hypothetical protein
MLYILSPNSYIHHSWSFPFADADPFYDKYRQEKKELFFIIINQTGYSYLLTIQNNNKNAMDTMQTKVVMASDSPRY